MNSRNIINTGNKKEHLYIYLANSEGQDDMKKIDFEADLKNEILIVSKNIGFKIAENQDLNNILLDYLTVRTKVIEPKHRNVFVN